VDARFIQSSAYFEGKALSFAKQWAFWLLSLIIAVKTNSAVLIKGIVNLLMAILNWHI
jgi:hypothetical protein